MNVATGAVSGAGNYPEFVQVTDVRGRLAMMGLGSPGARAATAAALVGTASYFAQVPAVFFRPNGTARPWKLTSAEPDAMPVPFFLVPVTAAALAYVFT